MIRSHSVGSILLLSSLESTSPRWRQTKREKGWNAGEWPCSSCHMAPISLGQGDKADIHRWSRLLYYMRGKRETCKMLLISLLYAWMFVIIRGDRQHARPVTLKRREDSVLAFRFFLIVLTDCLCWIPIIAIKLAALCNVKISRKYYTYTVKCVVRSRLLKDIW
ncbi:relaxin receptor 1-like, partial [Tropilaelaps mercedesae]